MHLLFFWPCLGVALPIKNQNTLNKVHRWHSCCTTLYCCWSFQAVLLLQCFCKIHLGANSSSDIWEAQNPFVCYQHTSCFLSHIASKRIQWKTAPLRCCEGGKLWSHMEADSVMGPFVWTSIFGILNSELVCCSTSSVISFVGLICSKYRGWERGTDDDSCDLGHSILLLA